MGLLGNLFSVFTGSNQEVLRVKAQELHWRRKAAEQGNAEAQYMMGVLYHGKDYAQAMMWFRKAADQGNAEAQLQIGGLYSSGRGVPQDDAQAASWFRKAADQGNVVSQYGLGCLYAKGSGVRQDYAQAMMWFFIIEASGSLLANRDMQDLETQATSAQITEAKKMAQEWLATHPLKKYC